MSQANARKLFAWKFDLGQRVRVKSPRSDEQIEGCVSAVKSPKRAVYGRIGEPGLPVPSGFVAEPLEYEVDFGAGGVDTFDEDELVAVDEPTRETQ